MTVTSAVARLSDAIVDRYRVERELGAGGMATVYLAHDLRHDRDVAIKVLHPELAATLGTERFLAEIHTTARLQHPHILPLLDSGTTGGLLYYVMPLVAGPTLRGRLTTSGALPIEEAVRIIRELADALAYSHRSGVVHRDIKPENVLLSGGHALVMDFGVAKALGDAQRRERPEGDSPKDRPGVVTTRGVALGTPAYMAPEQATADRTLDHRVDIYALGVVAYEILSGRAPFTGHSLQQLLLAHITQRPEPLSLHRPNVPPELEAVVMRCLEKDPADRWPDADAIVRAVDAVATLAAPRRPARWRWVVGGGIATVTLLATGLAWYGQVGRLGTLIGRDVLAENDLVLVSEFENGTADSTLAATLTDAIRVDLQESRAIQVMSPAAMASGLARMGLALGAALPDAKVQELAEREGAKAFVVGNVARIGTAYQITARVIATNGGGVALTARAVAKDETELIGAVEQVGRKLRRGIGESLGSVSSAPPLAQVTTASLPALRAYTAAQRAEAEGARARAIALAKEALALDTGFAAAWAALYVTHTNLGSVRLAAEAAQHAYERRDRLSGLERLRVEANYHWTRGEVAEEEAAWARLAELGRGEVSYSNMLLGFGRLRDAEEMARRAVASTPKASIAYWNLAEAQVGQQHWAAAESTAALVAERLPDNPYRYFIPVSIRWARRDFDAVEAYLRSPEGGRLPSTAAVSWRCLLHLQRGRIRAWQSCPLGEGPLVRNPLLAVAEFRLTGDSARARGVYAPFLALGTEQRNPDEYPGMITLLADVGRVREARSLLDEWRSRTGPADPGYRGDSALAVGAVAVAEGAWERALAAFRAWGNAPAASAMHFYNRGLPEAAAVYRRLEQPDSAIALLERALATSSLYLGGGVYEAGWYPQSLLALGDLYESRGDRAKAVDYYRRYVATLADADPPIAAQVAAVRQKLTRVTGDR